MGLLMVDIGQVLIEDKTPCLFMSNLRAELWVQYFVKTPAEAL